MADSTLSSITTDFPRIFPARWGFWKGLGAGAVVEIPAISGSVWLSGWLIGRPAAPFANILRLTALFAGVAALLTAGGIGRLAAYSPISKSRGGRYRAALVAARAHAVASLALVFIAALPHRHLPAHIAGWLALFGIGALIGAGTGAAIGLICSGPAPVGIADVVALARKPGHALHELIDPEDLRHLGAALRDRTEQLLTGMFEPVQPPPADSPTDSKAETDLEVKRPPERDPERKP